MAYAPPQFDDASANLVPQEPPPPIGGVAQQRPAPALRAPRLGGLGTLTGAGDGYARLDNAESVQEDPRAKGAPRERRGFKAPAAERGESSCGRWSARRSGRGARGRS